MSTEIYMEMQKWKYSRGVNHVMLDSLMVRGVQLVRGHRPALVSRVGRSHPGQQNNLMKK